MDYYNEYLKRLKTSKVIAVLIIIYLLLAAIVDVSVGIITLLEKGGKETPIEHDTLHFDPDSLNIDAVIAGNINHDTLIDTIPPLHQFNNVTEDKKEYVFEIKTSPKDMKIFIDGNYFGRTNAKIYLRRGMYLLELQLDNIKYDDRISVPDQRVYIKSFN